MEIIVLLIDRDPISVNVGSVVATRLQDRSCRNELEGDGKILR